MDAALTKAFYAPGALHSLPRLLRVAREHDPNISADEVKQWRDKQEIYQLLKKPPRPSNTYQSFRISKVNDTHQADLLYLPTDSKYKYALVVVDVASRYYDAEPLKSKTASEVADAFRAIYKRGPLKWPTTMMVDSGTEFKSEVEKMFKDGGTNFKRAPPAAIGGHRKQAIAEAANRVIAMALFRLQDQKELLDGKVSTDWVANLPAVLKAHNQRKTKSTALTPAAAIKRTDVQLNQSTESNAEVAQRLRAADAKFPQGSKVRHTVREAQQEGAKKRATDKTYTTALFTVKFMTARPGEPVYAYLDGPGAPPYGVPLDELQRVSVVVKPPKPRAKPVGRPAEVKEGKRQQKIVKGRTTTGRTVKLPAKFTQ